MSEAEGSAETTGAGEDSGTRRGSSLFSRFRPAPELTPAERKRRLAYAGGGVIAVAATVVVAVFGVRRWRGRRG
jgi:hypothetical protein